MLFTYFTVIVLHPLPTVPPVSVNDTPLFAAMMWVVVVVLPSSSRAVVVTVVATLNTVAFAAVNAASEQVIDVTLLTVSPVPNFGAKSK